MLKTETAWDLLSSTSAQVLICDLQKQIVARSKTTTPQDLGRSAGVLLQLGKLFKLPILLSVVPEENKAPELIPELSAVDADVPQMLRSSASPFLDQDTVDTLAGNNRQVLLLSGFAIEATVFHAALDGIKHGYKVVVIVDACGGMSERTEQAAFRQIEAAGGVITSVVSLATTLAPDFTTDLGKQTFSLIQRIRLS